MKIGQLYLTLDKETDKTSIICRKDNEDEEDSCRDPPSLAVTLKSMTHEEVQNF